MSDLQKQIDHEFTREIVCPYCGYGFAYSGEYHDCNGESIACQDCEEYFDLKIHYHVNYSTCKLKDTP